MYVIRSFDQNYPNYSKSVSKVKSEGGIFPTYFQWLNKVIHVFGPPLSIFHHISMLAVHSQPCLLLGCRDGLISCRLIFRPSIS